MTVASQVGEVLPDRAPVAQVMVTGEVTGEARVGRMPGVERLNSDWGEFPQACGNGGREVVESREFGRRWVTSGWFASGGRKGEPIAPMQFEQEGVGGHVLEPPAVRAPVPNEREFLGKTTAMPIRVGSDQLADFYEVLLGEKAALDAERSLHMCKGNKKGVRKSSEILLATPEIRLIVPADRRFLVADFRRLKSYKQSI